VQAVNNRIAFMLVSAFWNVLVIAIRALRLAAEQTYGDENCSSRGRVRATAKGRRR
jgi:hypothetical protein